MAVVAQMVDTKCLVTFAGIACEQLAALKLFLRPNWAAQSFAYGCEKWQLAGKPKENRPLWGGEKRQPKYHSVCTRMTGAPPAGRRQKPERKTPILGSPKDDTLFPSVLFSTTIQPFQGRSKQVKVRKEGSRKRRWECEPLGRFLEAVGGKTLWVLQQASFLDLGNSSSDGIGVGWG